MKGHTLKREHIEGADHPNATNRYRWTCECGVTFGGLSVHRARKVWREHKDAIA